jgi:hypothetical protein
MAEGNDHYAVLGLAPSATAVQIKAAYRRHAKSAHPDAGGSVEAMARVNEAYKVLGDPTARQDYDEQRRSHATSHHSAGTSPSHEPTAYGPGDAPAGHRTAEDHRAAREEAAYIQHQRNTWARHSAWEMARLSAPVAVAVVLAMYYVPGHLATLSARLAAGLLTFIPVYSLVLSIIFLINPALRLVFADLVRHHPTTHHERLSALGVVLAFFPLGVIWILFFLPW